MKRIILLTIIVSITAGFISCNKKEINSNPNFYANEQLVLTMEEYYLWYDMLPEVDLLNYKTPVELMNALTYKELDRWSYVTTKQEIEAYYANAEYTGYGIGMGFDSEDNLWITFIFDDSPLKEFGVNRGWRITKINNTPVTYENANSLLAANSASFTFLNQNNEEVTANAAKKAVKMNTVLMDTVYSTATGNIGYFVLKGFVTPTVAELDSTFKKFKENDVKELIVDLRYNGGGSVETATHLANLIAGKIAANQILGTYKHNDKKTEWDSDIKMELADYSLDLSRVVYITTSNSASASELVINGLFPFMDVKLVGGNTHGKPVGMYVLESKTGDFDWVFVPICFKIVNANGDGDYYDGIPADFPANDGINYPFGNLDEASLAKAMEFLTGGSAPKSAYSTQGEIKYPMQRGLRNEIGAW
ncbi:MAG: S41 family peptidase [Bacteroidales bacterium]|jgi:C-terminal processing protease CtpA/Prc|nr:S41 family peptidase [Bacteroidales bacterium]MDD4673055.1 S41 family peptidase [Bacteroidales bacterium]